MSSFIYLSVIVCSLCLYVCECLRICIFCVVFDVLISISLLLCVLIWVVLHVCLVWLFVNVVKCFGPAVFLLVFDNVM